MNGHSILITHLTIALKRALSFAGRPVVGLCVITLMVASATSQVKRPITSGRLSAHDEAFLEDLSRRAFRYFWEQSNPQTGLVLDRSKTDGSASDENHRTIASIASTGFGLTALCIAAERRWIDPAQARERVAATLRFFAERATHEHGWFYHWMDVGSGERRWQSEISSIDTALLLGGVLAARGYYQKDAEIKRRRSMSAWISAGCSRVTPCCLVMGGSRRADSSTADGRITAKRPCFICSPSAHRRTRSTKTRGTPGGAIGSPSKATVMRRAPRRCSSINTRTPGLIIVGGATASRRA
jgi:hypothetical protein